MQWLRLSLLASLCGVLSSAVAPIANTNTSIDASRIFDVLYPRVETGPGGSAPSANIEDLFDLLDSCKGKRDVVQGWLNEVKKLHSVFEQASRDATDIPPYAVIFKAMFGTMPFHAFVDDPATMNLVKGKRTAPRLKRTRTGDSLYSSIFDSADKAFLSFPSFYTLPTRLYSPYCWRHPILERRWS